MPVMRTRPAAFALALSSLLLIVAGVAVDGSMLTLPLHARAACTDSSDNVTYITSNGTYCEGPNPAIRPWLGALIAALGIALLVVAFRLDRRPGERPRQGWRAVRAWAAPLLWLAAIPAVSVLLGYVILRWEVGEPACQITYGFFGSTASCPVSAIVPSVLVPGLLYLVPVRWIPTSNPRKRIAAITASFLGLASLAGFVWALFSQGPTVDIDSGLLPPLLPPGDAGLVFGTVGWLSALIALLVIAKLPFGINDASAPQKATTV